jgi:crotonobetainyl-CoA:carnitine CoA-transferase CaiB-like acyl-CoA transferase
VTTQQEQPLSGRRILEIGGTLAVAAATKQFADYGGTVIKVEPAGGSTIRRLPPFPADVPSLETGAYHLALDTGKRSIVLDLDTPSGAEVLGRLIRSVDLVFVHGPASRAERVRDLVAGAGDTRPSLVAMTDHGIDGPYHHRTENDTSLFALSGRMRAHGIAGEEPFRYAPEVGLMQWGATAATVGMAALWGRASNQPPRLIEVTGVEALAGNVDTWFIPWEFAGAESPREPGQSRTVYPGGCYRCKDGYVVFAAATPPFFNRLREAIGGEELLADPRFTDPAQKVVNFDAFMEFLMPWLEARTRQEVFHELQKFGVMVAPMLNASELATEPQAVARGSFVDVALSGDAHTTIAAAPFRMGNAWSAGPAPHLGEHTDAILAEMGYSPMERLALFRGGVTG